MSPTKKTKTNRPLTTLNTWFSELQNLQTCLELPMETSYKASTLRSMGMQLSNLDLETEGINSSFFVPLPTSRITPSICASPHHLSFPTKRDRWTNDDYGLGKTLAGFHLLDHFLRSAIKLKSITTIAEVDPEIYSRAKWTSTSSFLKWEVCGAFTVCDVKPHVLLILASNCKADDNTILESELEALMSFMRVGVEVESEKKKLVNKRARHHIKTHMICPVLMVSVINTLQARIIQGYYDGELHIQYSKLYNFDTVKHQESMDLFTRWMIPRARGNTTWSSPLPSLAESSEDEHNEVSE